MLIIHDASKRNKRGRNEVLSMPFDGSYIDHDKQRYLDSQDYLVGIARNIIRDPLSVHVIKTHTKSGKIRFLIVDRTCAPDDGDIAVISGDNGLRAGRITGDVTSKDIWGKVIWVLQEG